MKLLIIKKLLYPHCNKRIFIMNALFIINHRVMTSGVTNKKSQSNCFTLLITVSYYAVNY